MHPEAIASVRLASDEESRIATATPSTRDGFHDEVPVLRDADYSTHLDKLEKSSGPLTDDLFFYQEFGLEKSVRTFEISKKATFSNCRNDLKSSLVASPNGLLQLCILATTPVSNEVFSWPAQLIATTRGRLRKLLAFPKHVIAAEVSDVWRELSVCTLKSITDSAQILRVEAISLPEFRRQFLTHSATDCKCRRFQVANISNNFDMRPLRDYDQTFKIGKSKIDLHTNTFSLDLPSSRRDNDSWAAKQQADQCLRIFSRDTASFSFTWQRAAPHYAGGFDTFLWERHSKPPPCDYAEVFYQEDKNTGLKIDHPRRVFMTVSTAPDWMDTTPLLGDLKSLLNGKPKNGYHMWPVMEKLLESQDVDRYALLPLFLVFEQAIQDTARFTQQAHNEITKISYAGRSASSVEKIQYFCHLDDCRESALLGLKHVLSVADDLHKVAKEHVPTVLKFLEDKQLDMDHLIKELDDNLRKRIIGESEEIRQHRDLKMSKQMSTLTYIATVWVPFSFLTGMLSMQVSDPALLFSGRGRNSYSTTNMTDSAVNKRQLPSSTSSAVSLPTDVTAAIYNALLNLTETDSEILSNASAISSNTTPSGDATAHVWSFGLFLALAIILFFGSLMLPIVGPNLLRITVQRSYKIRSLFIFWPFVFAVYYICVYWVIPEVLAKHFGCHDVNESDPGGFCNAWGVAPLDNENGYGYYYTENFQPTALNPINFITYTVSATVMGAIALFQIVLAIAYRRGAIITSVWGLFAAVVIVVFTLDWYFPTEQLFPFAIASGFSLSAIVPLAYLLVVWSVVTYLEWKRKKRLEETKAVVEEEGKKNQ